MLYLFLVSTLATHDQKRDEGRNSAHVQPVPYGSRDEYSSLNACTANLSDMVFRIGIHVLASID